MTEKQEISTKRKPDCVTKVRVGNTILTVKGYFKQDATETAVDKMARAIAVEAVLRDLTRAAG